MRISAVDLSTEKTEIRLLDHVSSKSYSIIPMFDKIDIVGSTDEYHASRDGIALALVAQYRVYKILPLI